jgi:hypothetical protein
VLPVDPKKLHKKAKIQIFVTKAERTVTIPEETESGKPEGVEVEATEHTEIQALLLKLGKEMSFDTWVARNVKSKEFEGKLLGGFPGVRNLPRQARPKYAPAKEQNCSFADAILYLFNTGSSDVERLSQSSKKVAPMRGLAPGVSD